MLQQLARIINQIMQLSRNTAVNRPVDTLYPPTSAIDQRQQTVDGSQTTIAGDVNTEGGMVNTGTINTSGGDVIARNKNIYGNEFNIEALYLYSFDLYALSGVAESVKREITNKLSKTSESSILKQDNFALGLLYLDCGAYDRAIEPFAKAHEADPYIGKSLYYLTLARTGRWRKRPSSINRQSVRQMEGDLELATQMKDAQAYYLYLWALIKHEYYKRNHLRMDPPLVDELLIKAKELFMASTDKEALLGEIRQMQRHVKDTDGFIDSNINPLIYG